MRGDDSHALAQVAAGATVLAFVVVVSGQMSLQRTPRVGERAPDFTLAGPGGTTVNLGDLLKRGPIVLYFYPKDETSGCTVEACSFRDSHQEFVPRRRRSSGSAETMRNPTGASPPGTTCPFCFSAIRRKCPRLTAWARCWAC